MIADVLEDTRQRSLIQTEILRVEINLTENQIRLIDENSLTTATADDEVPPKVRHYNKTGIRISLADSKAELFGCSSGVSQTPAATACETRLDGSQDGQDANPGAGASRGLMPCPMADCYEANQSRKFIGKRYFTFPFKPLNYAKNMPVRFEIQRGRQKSVES